MTTGGILSGPEIERQIKLGNISVAPFDPSRVNETSLDLTLGTEVGVYEDHTDCAAADEWERLANGPNKSRKPNGPSSKPFGYGAYDGRELIGRSNKIMDTKVPAKIRKWAIDSEKGWVIYPGIGYLMHTVEAIHTPLFNPVVDGKSSVGRLFVKIHETAGYGEPGFDGQYTLEVTTTHFPIRVYPGMRIGQIRFHTIVGEIRTYDQRGHYRGASAQGAVASKIHETGFR